MKKEKFINKYLEKLVEDDGIKKYFDRAESDREREMMRENLRMSLERSYDTYAKEYFDSKGIGSYLSTLLRYGGAVADAIGTYMFWTIAGVGPGFGMKGAGLAAKSAADVIEARRYAKYAKTKELSDKVSDSAKIAGEAVVERAAAYLPLGVGELADLMRGKSKFDRKVIGRAVQYAKNNFVDYLKKEEKEPYIVRLENFRNPAYANLEERMAA